MARAYVGLGANLGDRETTIRRAVELLADTVGVEVLAVSALRETDPVGVEDQPRFLNGAAALETTLEPRAVLEALLGIERVLGRVRDGLRFGPRTIDLDLLLFGDETIDLPDLKVPHPELPRRAFVLVPLVEVDPHAVHPVLGLTMRDLLSKLDSGPTVRRMSRL